jgi:hypothetical protein
MLCKSRSVGLIAKYNYFVLQLVQMRNIIYLRNPNNGVEYMSEMKFRLKNTASDCCGSKAANPGIQMKYSDGAGWVNGSISTALGEVQQVSVKLGFQDILGSVKARLGINRDNYKIEPGLYCVGNPDSSSPVLVTANYKMTFDSLRMELSGLNAWLLVLDTRGINVWCAAGKGTFGTRELVNRIAKVRLGSVVSHRTIVLPQLAASGVSAHEVAKRSGFRVIYGPVRASDIKTFLQNGMSADINMRTVKFIMADRLVLTPLEFVNTIKPLLIVFGVLFILNMTGLGNFGIWDLYAVSGAVFAGAVLTPVLLPYIPGRAFSFKGWLMGFLWTAGIILLGGFPGSMVFSWLAAVAYILVLPAVSSYLAMNFTGCSTYTSFSGVKREMKTAIPLLLISLALGILVMLADIISKLI